MSKPFKIILALWAIILSNDCFAAHPNDSITVFRSIDTVNGFIQIRKNKVRYSEDGAARVEKSFFIDVPEDLENFSYHHRGSTNYCEFSFSDGSKIVIEITKRKRRGTQSGGNFRLQFSEFKEIYKLQTGKDELSFTDESASYTDLSNRTFGIVRKRKYLVYYFNVDSLGANKFDMAIKTLRKRL